MFQSKLRWVSLLFVTCFFGFAEAQSWFGGWLPMNPLGSQMESGTYKGAEGERNYLLYKPTGDMKNSDKKLLLVLHGCFQTAQQMATGTEFNTLAEKKGFYVLYPDQTYSANPWKCWNWFEPENNQRTKGELSLLANMTLKVLVENGIKKGHVVVTGLSAGGAMASNLQACYSDIFNGLAVHSGMEFMAALSESEAHQVTKNGSSRDLKVTAKAAIQCSPKRSRFIPVLVIHGTKDPFVNTINADRVIRQGLFINDYLDDGQINNSISWIESQFNIKGGASGYGATGTSYKHNNKVILTEVWVEGMAHAWSGGSPVAPYMDPRGVSASEIIVDAFGL